MRALSEANYHRFDGRRIHFEARFFRWSPDTGVVDTGLTACEKAYRKETDK